MPDRDQWPECVRKLAIDPTRQLPVPFVTPYEDGRAAYTALDPVRKLEIAKHRLCGVCGLVMPYWLVFLGDIVSIEPGGIYVEPPLHEACALASMELCPFISRARVPRRPPDERDVYISPPGTFEVLEEGKRPWVMAYCHDFKLVPNPGWGNAPVTEVFRHSRIVRVRVFAYGEDGRLHEQAEAAV